MITVANQCSKDNKILDKLLLPCVLMQETRWLMQRVLINRSPKDRGWNLQYISPSCV